ncbi:MAG: hypothetical protein ACD_46C00505G0001 [uncultured bacterium]|nr:MAG: hypothetical protein ACD_46C00505G0001 [uncultured bacterium]
MVSSFVNTLQGSFNLQLSETIVFSYSTPRKLSTYIAEKCSEMDFDKNVNKNDIFNFTSNELIAVLKRAVGE